VRTLNIPFWLNPHLNTFSFSFSLRWAILDTVHHGLGSLLSTISKEHFITWSNRILSMIKYQREIVDAKAKKWWMWKMTMSLRIPSVSISNLTSLLYYLFRYLILFWYPNKLWILYSLPCHLGVSFLPSYRDISRDGSLLPTPLG
jgi:hypothetical protein